MQQWEGALQRQRIDVCIIRTRRFSRNHRFVLAITYSSRTTSMAHLRLTQHRCLLRRSITTHAGCKWTIKGIKDSVAHSGPWWRRSTKQSCYLQEEHNSQVNQGAKQVSSTDNGLQTQRAFTPDQSSLKPVRATKTKRSENTWQASFETVLKDQKGDSK